MNLKDSFRYMNHLTDLFEETLVELNDSDILMNTKEIHLRKKSNPNADDETIENVNKSNKAYTAKELLKLTDIIMEEMEFTSKAITSAKKETSIDIDQATTMNKKRQAEIARLKKLANLKASETRSRGMEYMLNNENNQVPYYYDITVVKTIDFDRNDVKKKIKKLSTICDETSVEIEKTLLMTEVDIIPKIDFTDTLEDLKEKLLETT